MELLALNLSLDSILNPISQFFQGIASINIEPIFQILFVALIMLAGPFVIFILAFRGGDL